MLKTIGTRVEYLGPFRAIRGMTGTVVECRVGGPRAEHWSSVDFGGEVYDVEVRNLRELIGERG